MRVNYRLVITFSILFVCLIFCALSPAATQRSTGSTPPSSQSLVTWHDVADAPGPPRWDAGVAVFDGKLWILAGNDEKLDPLQDVWNSPDGVHWTKVVQEAPWRAWDAYTVNFKNRLWLIGAEGPTGNTGRRTWGAIWSSSDGVSWSEVISNAPWQGDLGRERYSVAVFHDRLWVMGGIGTNPYLNNDVWSSPDGVNWTRVVEHAPWTARYDFAAAVYADKLWVLGGYDDSNQLGDVWCTTDGAAWVNMSQNAWHEREGHYAAAFDGTLWVFGGFYDEGSHYEYRTYLLNEVQRSTDGMNWVSGPLPPGEGAVPCGVLDGKLWYAGFASTTTHIGYMSPVSLRIVPAQGRHCRVGASLSLVLSTTGFPGGTSCRWFKDGEAIPNATTDTYHVDQAEVSDSGSYTCQVTDENGTVFTTDPVPVTVIYEKVPAASPLVLALAVLLAATVLVFRRKSDFPRTR